MQRFLRIRIIWTTTLLAFLLGGLLPFFANYNVPELVQQAQSEEQQIASLFGDDILICTADGFKLVSLKDLREGGSESPSPHSDYECALCFVAAHGGKYAPANAAHAIAAPVRLVSLRLRTTANHEVTHPQPLLTTPPRAPPVFS